MHSTKYRRILPSDDAMEGQARNPGKMGQQELPLCVSDSANYGQLHHNNTECVSQHDAAITVSDNDISERCQDKSLLYIDDSATYDQQSQLDSQEELQLVQKYFDSPGCPDDGSPDGSMLSGSETDEEESRPPRRMKYMPRHVIHRVPPWITRNR